MTKLERWVLGLTDSQMWLYATSHPIFNCPLFNKCNLCREHCGRDECWQKFKKWANAPAEEGKSQ